MAHTLEGSTLVAYDEAVGTQLWSATVSTEAGINATPVIVNGIAYLSMNDGSFIAFRLTSNHTTPALG